MINYECGVCKIYQTQISSTSNILYHVKMYKQEISGMWFYPFKNAQFHMCIELWYLRIFKVVAIKRMHQAQISCTSKILYNVKNAQTRNQWHVVLSI